MSVRRITLRQVSSIGRRRRLFGRRESPPQRPPPPHQICGNSPECLLQKSAETLECFEHFLKRHRLFVAHRDEGPWIRRVVLAFVVSSPLRAGQALPRRLLLPVRSGVYRPVVAQPARHVERPHAVGVSQRHRRPGLRSWSCAHAGEDIRAQQCHGKFPQVRATAGRGGEGPIGGWHWRGRTALAAHWRILPPSPQGGGATLLKGRRRWWRRWTRPMKADLAMP
jgi:hypothetical protein